ncbi:CS1 type fimbrial major subunit [Pseudomonas sichuanensis]|uniref:CS1 type fimbrial major subunit n=1 Tax=Pseudomonas TaxID=286 RepID=UPI0036EC8D91
MKAFLLALPLALMAATGVQAADPIEKQVLITATVPTAAFYVEPVGGNWMNDPQDMAWNPVSSSFYPINKQLQAKSTIGPITARLLSPASIVSGIDAIDLNVRVGATDLSTTAQVVLPQAQAAAGSLMDFVVEAQSPAGGYKPGAYQGLVSMMFETAAP